MGELILASSSEIRKQLLHEYGVKFRAQPSPFDEELAKAALVGLSHKIRALRLANGKAQAVSEIYPDAYVIGADQICADGAQTYSKPITVVAAEQHLRNLRGKKHYQHSAACLYFAGEKIWESCEIVTLTMRNLSDVEISEYIALDEPFQACGAYCYEKNAQKLFEKIEGSAPAIKGLPMEGLIAALTEFCPQFLGQNHG